MVRVIREFRPNVVINGWGGVHGGHGHHQAAGLLTPKAVELASRCSFKIAWLSRGSGGRGTVGDRKPVTLLDPPTEARPPRLLASAG